MSATLLAFVATMALGATDTAFVSWAKASLRPLGTVTAGSKVDDLRPLGRMIGDARVVALTEGVHAAAEPLEFRNRLLRYLVEQKGFSAIAIESGVVESQLVHDYVRGAPGDLPNVVSQGITWTFDQLPQNQALVRWLREYNADPRHTRKVNFYGFDIPGSLNTPNPHRSPGIALSEALKYLARVDAGAADSFRARLADALPRIRYYLRNPSDAADAVYSKTAPEYAQLSEAERDRLTATIEELIALLERREGPYRAASSEHDYAWGYRAAIGARQSDEWLRQTPRGSPPAGDPQRAPQFLGIAADVRDRAQADNIEWVVQQEKDRGKVLVFAHLYHLSTEPVRTDWYTLAAGDSGDRAVAGTYLKRRFGNQLVTIGNLVGHGKSGCGAFGQTLNGPSADPADSIQRQVSDLGAPVFVLDLRTAPPKVSQWLAQRHSLGQNGGALEVSVGRAFDVILYLDTITPACRG